MTILDISDPASPKKVGEIETPGVVRDIFVDHYFAYVANGSSGLRVIDVSDPTRPTEIGHYHSKGYTNTVCVHRQVAYINGGSNVQILNVYAPAGPEKIGHINLVSNVSDIDVKAVGSSTYIFVANISDGLRVFDVTHPENPVEVGSNENVNPVYKTMILNDYAYVVSNSYLSIMNVSDPENIQLISVFRCSHGMHEIYVSDGYAYIADIYYGGLWIIDVRKPDNPNFVAYYIGDIRSNGCDVHIKDQIAYIACSSDGLYIVDVSVPQKPTKVSSFDTGFFCKNLVVLNDYAYVIGGHRLHIYDLSTPGHPQPLGSIEVSGNYTTDIFVSGHYAYFTCNDGLHIIDISDPYTPSEIGFSRTTIDASSVRLKDDYAYLACWDGLRVIDVSSKSNPVEVAFIESEDRAIDVEISGGHAFVVAVGRDPHHLYIFNIQTPVNPVLACSFSIPGYYIYDVHVSGMLAYVVSMSTGLRILDVSTPDNPVEIGAYHETFSLARNIIVSGDFAYMTDSMNGLRIIDVSDPESPSEIDGFRTHAYGLFVAGNLAYVTCGPGGFYILRHEVAEETDDLPSSISLLQNYPNPFNASTCIRFELSVPERVALTLFDTNGRYIETLVEDVLYNSGIHGIQWTAGPLPTGVYLVRLKAGDYVETKKMILLR